MTGRDPIDCLATRGRFHGDDQLLLATAAAAAFGGMWVHRLITDDRVDGWERFVAFAGTHRDLFDDLLPYAEVGVVYSTADMHAGFDDHFAACGEVAHRLLREQIPVKLIELADVPDAELAGCRVLLLPRVRCLAEPVIAKLRTYIERGGLVVTLGEAGTYDDLARKRESSVFDTFPRAGAAILADWPRSDEQWLAALKVVTAHLPGGGALVAAADVPGLRVADWRSADGEREVIHLLNYGVPANADTPTTPLPPFTLTLHTRRPASARLNRPGDEPHDLDVDGTTVKVPSVPVYAAIELRGVTAVADPPSRPLEALKPDVPPYLAAAARVPRPEAEWAGMPAFDSPVTRWRFAQTCVLLTVGDSLEVTVRMVGVGYPGDCRAVLLGTDGQPVAEAAGAPGEALVLRADGLRPGQPFVLLADPGRNAVEVDAAAPLTVVGKDGVFNVMSQVRRLYFYVPDKVERFWLKAAADSPQETATLVVERPDGREAGRLAGELDTAETLTLEVAPEHRGKPWSLTLASGPTGGLQDVRLVFDPAIPPYLADHPSRLLLTDEDRR